MLDPFLTTIIFGQKRKEEEREDYNDISLSWFIVICSERTSFASLVAKPIGP